MNWPLGLLVTLNWGVYGSCILSHCLAPKYLQLSSTLIVTTVFLRLGVYGGQTSPMDQTSDEIIIHFNQDTVLYKDRARCRAGTSSALILADES